MKGTLSLRGFRKLRTGAIVATGVFLIGLASVQTTVQASEEDGVWVARTVEQVKADIQKEDNFFKYEIKWGDTLSVISEATNIPVDVLKEMNRVSDRNLFLPHNELLYTEGESVTDSKTKHKIVIKESYGKKEVRTYEVVLQKNHETAEVSFELKETTEKVQESNRSVVSYDEVYNLVSEVAPAQPAEDQPAAPGTTETPTPAPAQPTEDQPAVPGTTEKPAPAQPTEDQPAGTGTTETPTPAQPTEEQPAVPGGTETPTPAQPTEDQPAGTGTTETPTPAAPAEGTPAGSGTTETTTPVQPAEDQPAAPGTPETPTPVQPAEEQPAAPGTTETTTPAAPAEEMPAGTGTPETPTPAQPAEEQLAAPGTPETPTPAQPTEEIPVAPGVTETPAPAQPTEEQPAAPGGTETPAPTKPVEEQPTAPGTPETPTPAQPADSGTTETPTPAAPAEGMPAGTGTTETPTPAQPAEGTPADSGITEKPTPAAPAEGTPAGTGTTENPNSDQPAKENETVVAEKEETESTNTTGNPEKNGENSVDKEDSVKKAKDDSIKENIMTVYNRKLEIINKLSDENEKNKLKMGLEALKNEAVAAITEANDENKVISVTEHYQTAIDGFEVPGEEFNGPDFSKEGLSNGRNDGTTIEENSSGNIGHASSSPTSNTSNEASNNRENTGFRNAPVYQPRVTRRARSVDEPMDKVAIYYNYTEMKDIAGFLGDPGESVVTVPKGATHEQVQAIVKSKIDEKKAELTKKGYTFLEDYFVDKPQEDTIRYDYIVNFTKPSSLRMAPMIQPRASRTRRSVEEPKVKTRTITLYYQLAELEIAGSLGNPGQNYVITVPETATAEEIQQAIDQQTSREKASLSRYFQYVGETNLQNDILDRGFGNFDYVITFARRK